MNFQTSNPGGWGWWNASPINRSVTSLQANDHRRKP